VVTEYRVRSGDTLISIAARFSVSVSSLQSLNGITDPNRLRIGQLLKIPTNTPTTQSPTGTTSSPTTSPAVRTYKVQSGDTLWGIARKFNVSADALAKLNNITNANLIKVGQTLKIPS
jgi:LysM repeat protein